MSIDSISSNSSNSLEEGYTELMTYKYPLTQVYDPRVPPSD